MVGAGPVALGTHSRTVSGRIRGGFDPLGRVLRRAIAAVLPWIVRWELRRGLRGVWLLGEPPQVPEGGFILAANHHAWWDVYLSFLVSERLDHPLIGMMDSTQLERFPFFRDAGVVADREVRRALRHLERGDGLILFPEGELTAPGSVAALRPGLAFLANKAEVPVLPLAIRVVLRGVRLPEAYLLFGAPIEVSDDLEGSVRTRLDALLDDIEHRLAHTHPEDVPEAAVPWLRGRPTTQERVGWWERWWGQ